MPAAINQPKRAQSVRELEREMLGPRNQPAEAPDDFGEDVMFTPAERKPIGKGLIALIVSLSWLALLGLFVIFLINDPTPNNSVRNWLTIRLNPDEETFEELFSDQILALEEQERLLDEEAEAVVFQMEELENQITRREEALNRREEMLHDLEINLEDRVSEMLAAAGGGGDQAAHAARTLQNMEPAAAARALAGMDDAVRVAALISARRLAPILAAMEEIESASEILSALSEPPEELEEGLDDLFGLD